MSYTYLHDMVEAIDNMQETEELKFFKTALVNVINSDPKLDGLMRVTALLSILRGLGLTREQIENNNYILSCIANKNNLDLTDDIIDILYDKINNNRYIQLTNQLRANNQ